MTCRERWTFRLAPLSSGLVWWGLIAAGNRGWLAGWSAREPGYVVSVLTLLTWLLCLAGIPIARRCHALLPGPAGRIGWVIMGCMLGGLVGASLMMIGSGFLLAGLLCGTTIGIVLAVALPAEASRGRCGRRINPPQR